MIAIKKTISYLFIIFFGFFYFLIHLRYLQMFLDSDQLVYLANVLYQYRGILFNPHHLFFEVHAYWFDQILRLYHQDFSDLAFNLRIRSLLSASMGIIFYGLLLFRLTKNTLLSIVGMVLIGFSHGYTHYASKIDTGIFPAAWFPIMILFSNYMFAVKRRVLYLIGIFILSIVFYLGVMQHQTMILAAVAIFVGWILPYNKNSKKTPPVIANTVWRWGGGLSLGIMTFIMVSMAYWAVGRLYYKLPYDRPDIRTAKGVWKYRSFQQWLFAYHVDGVWGKGHKEFDIRMPLRGLTDGFLSQQKMGDKYNQKDSFLFNYSSFRSLFSKYHFLHNMTFLILFFIALFLLLFSHRMAKIYGRTWIVLISALVLYFFLGSYWEPFYFEFWIMPVSIVWIVFILILDYIFFKKEKERSAMGSLFSGWMQNAVSLMLFLFVFLIAIYNFRYNTIPHSQIVYIEGLGRYKSLDFTNRYKMRKMYKKYPVYEGYPRPIFRFISDEKRP